MQNNSPDKLLTRNEVEAELGVTRRYLELSAWRGDGPPMIRIGRRAVRYRRGDVIAWIEKRRIDPEAMAERPARRLGARARAVPEGANPNERP